MSSKKIVSPLAAVILLFASAAAPTLAVKQKPAFPPDVMVPSGIHASSLDKTALHRLDFVVKGSSCPTCLLKCQKRIEKTKGVAQAAIMLNRPYGAVCIYDATKTNKDAILLAAKGDARELSFDMVEDEAIAKIPIVLVPHHSNEASPTKTQ